jgi:tetratricopeptide (TPR) repeat protein
MLPFTRPNLDFVRRAAVVVAALAAVLPPVTSAQELALADRQPFDRIVLKQGGPNSVLEVQPLDLPDRRVPNPLPSGSLRYRLTDPTKSSVEYEVPWSRILRVELFEQMLIDEARKLTQAGKFNEAFENYSQLVRRFPNTPGLNEAINAFLQGDALAAFKANEYDRALAVLGALYDRNPGSPGLANAVDTVAGKIIEQYLANKDFKAARLTLDVVAANFPKLKLSVVPNWRQRFQQAAADQMKVAAAKLATQEYAAARGAINQAIGVWPEIEGSDDLRRAIQLANPQVSVAVFEPAPQTVEHRIDSWPHTRTATLVQPLLAELVDYSPEGGIYKSAAGQIVTDATGLAVTVTVEPRAGVAASEVAVGVSSLARDLLSASSGQLAGANPALAELVEDVGIEYPNRVNFRLARPHVRPEALLRFPMPSELQILTGSVGFSATNRSAQETTFEQTRVGNGQPTAGMAVVREVLYENESDALSALVRGDVDVIDRVPPWQVGDLEKLRDLRVEPYKLPTVHVLVPMGDKPLVARREFRRALCYAIDRQGIVNRILLGGEARAGYMAVSGPFAAQDSLTEIVPYAYNPGVKPRDYDVRLGSMLMTVAWTSVQPTVPKDQEPPPLPSLPPLVLAHGRDLAARAACMAIKQQVAPLGLELQLMEMTADQLAAPSIEGVDLKYVELLAWEPVTDARLLLGASGLLPSDSDFLPQSLDVLDRAGNWNSVREEMFDIHRVASSELPVIPLWQTRNYYAFRRDLKGLAPGTVTLYQDIHRWQLDFD